METWIRRACRQRAYRQLWFWILITASIIAALYVSGNYWKNFFQGPYQVTAMDLSGLSNPESSQRQFLAITGEKIVPSGIQEITTQTRNGVKERSYVSSEYFLLVVGGNRLLIVQSQGRPPLQVEGELKPASMSLANSIFPDAADSDLKARLYPFYLSTTDNYRLPGYITLGGVLVYLIALWIFGRRAWRYTQNVALHPVVKRVESWSDAAEVAVMSEREMELAVRFKKAGIVVTDNFMIERGFLTFNLFPFHHLLWAYKKVTTRMVNFIPVARTSEAVFVFYGGSTVFPSRKKLVDEVLTYAAVRAPWAILGYSDELHKVFKKDTDGFCAAVEERRKELQ